jgi:hypothetical protein
MSKVSVPWGLIVGGHVRAGEVDLVEHARSGRPDADAVDSGRAAGLRDVAEGRAQPRRVGELARSAPSRWASQPPSELGVTS